MSIKDASDREQTAGAAAGVLAVSAPLACGAVGAALLVVLAVTVFGRRVPSPAEQPPIPTFIRELAVDVDAGHARYMNTCSACHGPSGRGMPMQGADLVRSAFVASRSNEQLLAFLLLGRQPGDRHSVMGRVMPPRGGNAGLDDADLADIVAYLRRLQVEHRNSTEPPTITAAVRVAGR
jgi:mono/diheme cytochrome c family protein